MRLYAVRVVFGVLLLMTCNWSQAKEDVRLSRWVEQARDSNLYVAGEAIDSLFEYWRSRELDLVVQYRLGHWYRVVGKDSMADRLVADGLEMAFTMSQNIAFKEDAQFFLRSTLDLLAQRNDSAGMGHCMHCIANFYRRNANYPLALRTLLEATKLYQQMELPLDVVDLRLSAAQIYLQQDMLDKCDSTLQLVFSELAEVDDPVRLSRVYGLAGSLAQARGDFQKARPLMFQSLKMAEAGGRKPQILRSMLYLGRVLYELNELDSASAYFQAIVAACPDKIRTQYANATCWLARLAFDRGDIDQALELASEAESVAIRHQFPAILLDIRHLLHSIHSQREDWPLATRYLEDYHALKDSLSSAEVAGQILALEQAHLLENERSRVRLLEERRVAQEEEIAAGKQTRAALLTGVAALLLITGIILRLLWLIRKKNGQLGRQLSLVSNLNREVHHRVKNNLQMISSLMYLEADAEQDPAFLKAMEAMRSRIRSMALVHQKLLLESAPASIDMHEYVHELVREIFLALGHKGSFEHVRLQISPIILPVEAVFPLGLIINEAVTNAMKHNAEQSSEGWLEIAFTEARGNVLCLQIRSLASTDEMSDNRNSTGHFGMNLMQVFAQKLSGQLSMTCANGTLLEVRFPYPETLEEQEESGVMNEGLMPVPGMS